MAQKHTELEQTIYDMLTENTGSHIADSGGMNGRHWQRNRSKSLEDFKAEDEASIVIDTYGYTATAQVFHVLSHSLELPQYTLFNGLKHEDWDGEGFGWGVSTLGVRMLQELGFTGDGRVFNTANDTSSPLSQVLQYSYVRDKDDELHVLLQIHNGCDIRGGYTDAKLFKVKCGDEYWLNLSINADIVKEGLRGFNLSDLDGDSDAIWLDNREEFDLRDIELGPYSGVYAGSINYMD